MGVWDRVKKAVGRRPKPEPMPVAVSKWEMAPPRRGGEALFGTYRESPWFRGVVEKVADGTAGVNWRIYRPLDEHGRSQKNLSLARTRGPERRRAVKEAIRRRRLVEVPDHPALTLLAAPLESPVRMTGRTLLKLVQLHLDIAGEAFIVLQRVGKYVTQLWPIPPHAVMSIPRWSEPDQKQVYRIAFGRFVGEIPAADMLHLRSVDPGDPLGRGAGIGFSLGDELDSTEYAAVFMKTFLHNFGIPSAVIGIEGLPPATGKEGNPQVKAFVESVNREHRGPENAGKVLVLGGKTTISRLDTSMREMELTEFRKAEHDLIRMVYGVPPEIMGDTSSSNVASARAAQAIFAENVLTPRAEFLRTELQARLLPLIDPDVILDYDSLIPADRDHELRVAAVAPWSRSVNEWRELQGLEPLPEFEGVFPPLAMPGQQVGDAGPAPEEEPDEMPAGEERVEDEKAWPGSPRDPAWARRPLRLNGPGKS